MSKSSIWFEKDYNVLPIWFGYRCEISWNQSRWYSWQRLLPFDWLKQILLWSHQSIILIKSLSPCLITQERWFQLIIQRVWYLYWSSKCSRSMQKRQRPNLYLIFLRVNSRASRKKAHWVILCILSRYFRCLSLCHSDLLFQAYL